MVCEIEYFRGTGMMFCAAQNRQCMEVQMEDSWKEQLTEEFNQPYFGSLVNFVREEHQTGRIYPPGNRIFAAFDACPFAATKVVILGQDPYHGPGQANGLCFAVKKGVPLPPSLQNIYKELNSDLGISPAPHGDLSKWARQGVFLLNATLTVRHKSPGSHQNKGWEEFTDAVVRRLSAQREGLVFFLWGAYAQRKGTVIDRNKHLVLEAPHPSPFSANRGFFGCRHFSRANAYLESKGKPPVDWRVE